MFQSSRWPLTVNITADNLMAQNLSNKIKDTCNRAS